MASIKEIFDGRLKKGDSLFLTPENAQFMRRRNGVEIFPDKPIIFTGISYGNKELYEFEVQFRDHIVISPHEDLFQFPNE